MCVTLFRVFYNHGVIVIKASLCNTNINQHIQFNVTWTNIYYAKHIKMYFYVLCRRHATKAHSFARSSRPLHINPMTVLCKLCLYTYYTKLLIDHRGTRTRKCGKTPKNVCTHAERSVPGARAQPQSCGHARHDNFGRSFLRRFCYTSFVLEFSDRRWKARTCTRHLNACKIFVKFWYYAWTVAPRPLSQHHKQLFGCTLATVSITLARVNGH